jgi:hypothetical protein
MPPAVFRAAAAVLIVTFRGDRALTEEKRCALDRLLEAI